MNLGDYVGRWYTGDHYCRVLVAEVLATRGQALPIVDSPEQAPGWEQVDRPVLGDVVVFNTAGKPDHVGVCDGRGGFLHCQTGCKSRIERLNSPMWSARIEGFYRCNE